MLDSDFNDYSGACIELTDVTKSFSRLKAIDQLSLSVPCGQKYALLGPNGAGKSTTLKLIVGLLKPDSGNVSVKGMDPIDPESRIDLGYLPEDASPYLTLSVRENLEYIGALRGVQDLRERVNYLIDTLELREYEKNKVLRLSRGNRQKLSIALSIIHKPHIVLMDEPLNYLDIPTQEKVISMLKDLKATFLVSTHIMSIAERLTENIIIISKGKVGWQGSMLDLKRSGSSSDSLETIVSRMMTGVS